MTVFPSSPSSFCTLISLVGLISLAQARLRRESQVALTHGTAFTVKSSTKSPYEWEQRGQTLVGDDPISFFGLSLDYSANGDVLAAGAFARDFNSTLIFTGNVRVYEFDYSTKMWLQLGNDINGQEALEFFGRPVALADKSLRVAIASASSSFPDVKVYEYDYLAQDWVQMGSNLVTADGNGVTGVAISSDGYTVAVGRSQNAPGTGFSRVFQYNIEVDDWEQLGGDIPGDQPGDLKGSTLAMSDDGRVLAVGSPQNTFRSSLNQTGFVSVYRFSFKANDWQLLGSHIPGIAPAEKVGLYGLDISADGTVVAIGVGDYDGVDGVAHEVGQARIYSFDKRADDWVQVGSGIDGINQGDRAQAVSLNGRGDIVAVGSPGFQNGTGQVRVFKFDHDDHEWKQIGSQILGDEEDDEAHIVALNARGDQLAVGIGGSDIGGNAAGAVRVYKLKGIVKSKGSKKKGRMIRKHGKKRDRKGGW